MKAVWVSKTVFHLVNLKICLPHYTWKIRAFDSLTAICFVWYVTFCVHANNYCLYDMYIAWIIRRNYFISFHLLFCFAWSLLRLQAFKSIQTCNYSTNSNFIANKSKSQKEEERKHQREMRHYHTDNYRIQTHSGYAYVGCQCIRYAQIVA